MLKHNIGNFLKVYHIERAFELIKLQIEDDKFSFKTLEFEIYRNENVIKSFDSQKFYDDFIKKDMLYNNNNIFFNIDYLIPKGVYGVRKFNFLSFQMLVLYYSLGFYIFDLIKESYEAIETKKEKRDNIATYYGGKINFEIPKNSILYYQGDYVEFNNKVNNQIENILNKKKKAIIIKLDIQDYFKSINIEILIDIIQEFAVPSNSKRYNFDISTIEEIKNLFLFINKSLRGVPLFSQNILSNFLSYLYLFELDNFVQNLKISREEDFVYFRYVDDFYLIYKRNKGIKNNIIGDEIFDITTSISEFLHETLDLKINELKTQAVIISDNDDFEKFIKKEKIISIPESLKKEQKPLDKLTEIKEIVEKLKKDYRTTGKISITTENSNKLKEIFSTSLKQYLGTTNAKVLVDQMFVNWYPVLTLSSTQALIYLLKHSKQNKLLKDFLNDKKDFKLSNPQYLFLLEKYLLSNVPDPAFNQEIIDIEECNSYLNLIKRMLDKNITIHNHNDISINPNILATKDTLMQQIKMLTTAEIEGKYNLAFNHLLNIYHYYCFINDKNAREFKKYNQINVTDFLDSLGLSIKEINFSMQFFDRRNKNNISHPGEELMESWAVNKEEYLIYKSKLNKLLKKIQDFI
ncbi:reverse transcriptase domain-containing protein [Chryseobacterium sp. KMC2]|uniref:reverse transcriptase domain-containing protein n=1 Tax=Chryseobacterium sp. KMC2 TaxID=2800705 RepID=UPI001923FEB0|nr:reverse transcriptase domain-containing protein [Chryseobacterium sp. KMC2]MBL3547064.1 hypothetical protein [Chryseobacterium sp. KMC2]